MAVLPTCSLRITNSFITILCFRSDGSPFLSRLCLLFGRRLLPWMKVSPQLLSHLRFHVYRHVAVFQQIYKSMDFDYGAGGCLQFDERPPDRSSHSCRAILPPEAGRIKPSFKSQLITALLYTLPSIIFQHLLGYLDL